MFQNTSRNYITSKRALRLKGVSRKTPEMYQDLLSRMEFLIDRFVERNKWSEADLEG